MAKDTNRSLLELAFGAFQRGDTVQTRTLALAVLAGKAGADEDKAAKSLASTLSSPGADIDLSPRAVAQELLRRTQVPAKAYAFAGAVAAVFLGLVLLAVIRYSS